MAEFKLSAVLEGHSDDVRAVTFAEQNNVLTASRDATVRYWRLQSQKPPRYDDTIISHGQAFVNTVAFLPSSPAIPEGLVFSGGQDTIIEARQPSCAIGQDADALLLGHEGNVCSLDTCAEGNWIVSGSWDCSARVWPIGKWDSSVSLDGHQGSVWAVLAYDKKTIITGSADKGIRIFSSSGKLERNVRGSKDVVRALCKLGSNHPTGAQFASAGNDGVIRLWTLDGHQVAELHGHESFIYSLDTLPTGEIVSSGEDRTVRIWKNTECVQTITHPAISVWSVSVSRESGDIVSGASDKIARVFTRSSERFAEAAVIEAFEEAVRGSSIPQQQVGEEINKEKLPGPEYLIQKSGTKDGQVQMIKENNGNITAHQWSVAQNSWIAIGTVVDSVGSSGRKTEYLGQDYDYVFDVDIEDGAPPLKLPYNLSQNPYEAATKFIQDNELPMTYLDQVANFITSNTQGASLGQSSAPAEAAGGDPWGQERRYRPGDVPGASQQTQSSTDSSRPKVLPQKDYLFITTANLQTIHKKICELNEQLVSSGHKDVSFSPSDLDLLGRVCQQLSVNTTGTLDDTVQVRLGVKMALKIVTTWPAKNQLPGFDLVRLLAAKVTSIGETKVEGFSTDLVSILEDTKAFDPSADVNENCAMLATRAFANLFATEAGRGLIHARCEKILSMLRAVVVTISNRNLAIAATTFYINLAVYLSKASEDADSEDFALDLLGTLDRTLRVSTDSEVVYRALVSLGTLLHGMGEEIRGAALSVYEFKEVLQDIETKKSAGKEPRTKGVLGEIAQLLNR